MKIEESGRLVGVGAHMFPNSPFLATFIWHFLPGGRWRWQHLCAGARCQLHDALLWWGFPSFLLQNRKGWWTTANMTETMQATCSKGKFNFHNFSISFKMKSKGHRKINIQCYTNLKWPGRWGGRGSWTTGTRRWRCRRSRPPWWRRWSWWWPSNIEENEMREIFSITGEGGSSTRGGGQADKVGFFPSFLISQLAKFLFLNRQNS